jgi:hypothetical protein
LSNVSGFGGETKDPRSWILEVDFGVTRVYGLQSNTTPSSEFNEVFNSRNSNLRLLISKKYISFRDWTYAEHGRVLGDKEDSSSGRQGDFAASEDIVQAQAAE